MTVHVTVRSLNDRIKQIAKTTYLNSGLLKEHSETLVSDHTYEAIAVLAAVSFTIYAVTKLAPTYWRAAKQTYQFLRKTILKLWNLLRSFW